MSLYKDESRRRDDSRLGCQQNCEGWKIDGWLITYLAEQRCWNLADSWGRGNDSNREADSCYGILKGTVIDRTRIFQMKFRIWSEAESRVWLIEYSYSKIHTPDTELGNCSGKRRGGSGGSQGQTQGNEWKFDYQRARQPAPALPALRNAPTRLAAQLKVFSSAPAWDCCFKWS